MEVTGFLSFADLVSRAERGLHWTRTMADPAIHMGHAQGAAIGDGHWFACEEPDLEHTLYSLACHACMVALEARLISGVIEEEYEADPWALVQVVERRIDLGVGLVRRDPTC